MDFLGCNIFNLRKNAEFWNISCIQIFSLSLNFYFTLHRAFILHHLPINLLSSLSSLILIVQSFYCPEMRFNITCRHIFFIYERKTWFPRGCFRLPAPMFPRGQTGFLETIPEHKLYHLAEGKIVGAQTVILIFLSFTTIILTQCTTQKNNQGTLLY